MKRLIVWSCLLLAAAAMAVEVDVDIFRSEKDPRVTVFSIPAPANGEPVKNFVMESNGKKYFPQVQKISFYPNGAVRWYRLIADVPQGRYHVKPRGSQKNPFGNPVKVVKKYNHISNGVVDFTYEEKPFALRMTTTMPQVNI